MPRSSHTSKVGMVLAVAIDDNDLEAVHRSDLPKQLRQGPPASFTVGTTMHFTNGL